MVDRIFVEGLLVPLLIVVASSCGPPRGASVPADHTATIPAELSVTWRNEQHGVVLDLLPEGKFEWRQEGLVRKGVYWVEGESLVMLADGKYETRYALVQLVPGQMTLSDPAGTTVSFTSDTPAPEPVPEPQETAAFDPALLEGVWTSSQYDIRIELAGDGHFVWKQGGIVESGSWEVVGESVAMSTGGQTSAYRIASLGETALTLFDPKGNELPLEKVAGGQASPQPESIGKTALLAGTPPVKIVNISGDDPEPAPASDGSWKLEASDSGQQSPPGDGAVGGPGGIFHFSPPGGWKVDTQKVCGNKFSSKGMSYSCWNRNNMQAPDQSRVHFDFAVFATWAAPGALDSVTPRIDEALAAWDADHTSSWDEIEEMAGYEVFSTRVGGRASSGPSRMMGRIIGIHYGELLIVGLMVLSADDEVFEVHDGAIVGSLDSMSFHVVENEGLASSLVGSWQDAGGSTWTFGLDGRWSGGDVEGAWIVLGETLVMAAEPWKEGPVTASPVSVENGLMTLEGRVLKKD